MKTIRTAAGVRRIDDSGDHVTVFKLREALYEHRKLLIHRIQSDPNAYLVYKFNVRLNAQELKPLLNRLNDLATGPLDLGRYESIVREFQHQQTMVLSNVLFYQEIDEHIYEQLNSSQLKLVS